VLKLKTLNEKWPSLRKPVVSCFILFYLLCYGLIETPQHWQWRTPVLHGLRPMLRFLGLWHYLPLFSPSPPDTNELMEVVVVNNDGTESNWQYAPRFVIPELSQLYLRFANMYFTFIRDTTFWADYGRYVARHWRPTDPHSDVHPTAIKFLRHWAFMPPARLAASATTPPLTRTHLVYTYLVLPEDLR
jgi:hypothetical protein